MGLLDTDSTSDGSLNKLWDNIGDITSQSYAEHAGDNWGVTLSTPNNDIITHNQFVVVHKYVDALQEELGNAKWELSRQLNECENVYKWWFSLCNKLAVGFQDMGTKLSELLIDDTFVKDLQWNVESIQKNLDEFKNVYTSFFEKSFVPLMGNVDTNNIYLNELGKDNECPGSMSNVQCPMYGPSLKKSIKWAKLYPLLKRVWIPSTVKNWHSCKGISLVSNQECQTLLICVNKQNVLNPQDTELLMKHR